MRIKKNIKVILVITLFIAVGTSGCDTVNSSNNDTGKSPFMMGAGCVMNSPIVMTATTYDINDQIISASRKTVMNMSVRNAQPNMTNIYEIYASAQLDVDFAGFNIFNFIQDYLENPDKAMAGMLGYVTQTPLRAQFWALNKMETSISAGPDGVWLTADDTIDPKMGYFVTTHEGNRFKQIKFKDFGITPTGRTDFIVEENRKTKTYSYEAGSDGTYGTDDDVLVRTTVFLYNGAGQLEKAINYSDDETTFESVFVFSYDENGRSMSMYSYEDEAGTNRLAWGSYAELTWGESEGMKTLDLAVGLRPDVFGEFDIKMMKFNMEFNEDGTIRKMIQYKPLSSNIDTCYVYVYSGFGFMSIAKMNEESYEYSDNEITQKSYTVNKVQLGK
jgi:hypothetical protein